MIAFLTLIGFRFSTSLALWAIPADEKGGPRLHLWLRAAPWLTIGFQTTVGRHFEHLAARKHRRALESIFEAKIQAGGPSLAEESAMPIYFGRRLTTTA